MTSPTILRRLVVARMLRTATIAGAVMALADPAIANDDKRTHEASPRASNAVVYWNTIAGEAFTPSQGTNPMAQSRSMAILHASVHDALNAIERRYQSYTPGLPAAPKASADAAVAAAAREVLITLLPERAALVEAAYDRALMQVGDGAARTAGIATGQAAARATMNRRLGDGAATAAQPAYVPRTGPGEYQFTAPFDFSVQPGWGRVRPFVIELRDHDVEGPLALTDAAYARDLDEVRAIGQLHSKTRTADQSEISAFWYEDSPLGWNRIANAAARARKLDAWDAARAFALLHFAMADGFIAGFDAKYKHRFWRPVTAIHAAAVDGNSLTKADPSWQPLLVTPPVPDYPSTHTVLGWAAAEVLVEIFGDKHHFSATSLTLPGVTRHYRGLSQAAQENGMSRLYAGIHFRHAIKNGQRQGRSIGRTVAQSLAPQH